MKNPAAIKLTLACLSATLVLGASRTAHAQWATVPECYDRPSAKSFQLWEVSNLVNNVSAGLHVQDRKALELLTGRIDACKAKQPDLREKTKVDRCMARSVTYVDLIRPPKGHDLGLVADVTASPLVPLSNADYFAKYGPSGTGAAQNQLAIPACLVGAEVFDALKDVNLGRTPPGTKTKKAQAANGLAALEELIKLRCKDDTIVLPYITQVTPALDAPEIGTTGELDKHGRVVIYLKDSVTGIGHYTQFSVNAHPEVPATIVRRQASVVNVIPDQGAHVFDWNRTNTGGVQYNPKFGNDQKCYQCHLSGMLEIHPFGPGQVDFGAGDTLGDDWEGRISALNQVWAGELMAMNKTVRAEYKKNTNSGVLHGLRADAITAPAMAGFPSLFDLRESRMFEFGDDSECDETLAEALKVTGTPRSKESCSSCHNQRGIVVPEIFAPSVGFMPLLSKYVIGGLMPPDHATYMQKWGDKGMGEVVNTAHHPSFAKLGECLLSHSRQILQMWLQGHTAGCD